ncbi:flavin reductase family protein [Rhodoplanes sp. TEM]|uniref:Flavin reductase family protein n=1 Tax=Rhodoplanes tepidamans TaxID=200616 RepID=A0ABT5JJ58_RHOTP|nr:MULTISPECIES: flavin reductase family protein [Rhodoplanes]MDC7789641.1 flavin reductase family protein [Rhodoplanes tepidamans]MDC7985250.1 flavin reductase family protein [Rhodoplanes sp. TEM]MDQ0353577.1 flavin reductase (DIM6/NTAB) family NADH-FMN oxidoreductase RutF [Rhodoplanes tepidamans]
MSDDFVTIDSQSLDTEAAYRLIVGCVVPRPVAWITSVDRNGLVNAAPFSSYNYVATTPPMLAVNIALRPGTPVGTIKDTARNITESREFVVNVATEATMELMHRTGQNFPPEISEVEALGIPLLPSSKVAPPRIALSPVQMECRLDQVVVLGRGINTLYIGEVVAFHLSPDIYDGRRVDGVAMRPIARLGGPFYAALGEIFERPMLQRPPGGEGWAGGEKEPRKDG